MHPLQRLIRLYRENRKAASTVTAAAGGGLYFLARFFLESDLWRRGFGSPVVWVFIVIGLGVGLAMFTYGFTVWREKRTIENIPTSKVRSLAMGLVEVSGQAQPKALLKSPITATDCVYYKFLVERRERRGKNDTWVAVSQGASTNYFYVDDGTGRILVDPVEADIHLAQDYRYTDAASAGNTLGLMFNVGSFGQRMRYTEWYIVPGDQVYVMGTITRWRNDQQERQFALAERLKELKADRDRLMQFDRDGDGKIDADEWEAARQQAEQDILRQELDNPRDESEDLVIARDPLNHLMIISDKSEKDLVKSKAATAWLLLIFGAALAVASLCFLVGRMRH
jgi:single-stranded DNA-binding protein